MTASSTVQLGRAVSRVDGPLKVRGQARYAAEFSAPGLVHGWVVSSAITRGRITKIEASAALGLKGVLHVFTHENRPALPWFDRSYRDQDAPSGSPLRPLYDDQIHYSGQPVALVVAESLELARYAATLVRIEYEESAHATDLRAQRESAYTPGLEKIGYEPPPKPRGDADKALAGAAVRIEAEYSSPIEHHNPIELHAATAIWNEDGSLTVYDKTQGVLNSQSYLSRALGVPKDKVRVLSHFVGGAFGSGLRPQYQLFLAVLAARELGRPVRVVLTRPQMFTFGYRPQTLQRVALGAEADGRLVALVHEAVGETSRIEEYVETVVNWSGALYSTQSARFGHKIARLDVPTPTDMRAPGAVLGVFAIECAMDELAQALNLDPIELRLRNYAERDQNKDRPFSSKELRACFEQGAEKFGWARRSPAPRSMRDGTELLGWGLATGVWEAMQMPARARAILDLDGRLRVGSATSDIGTGTYTVMTQIAAEMLGLPLEAVTFELGDSSLPMAPLQGGSWTVASVGSAVKAACELVRGRLLTLAQKLPDSPLKGARAEDVTFSDGSLCLTAEPSRAVSFVAAMRHGGVLRIEEEATAIPDVAKQTPFARCTHSAVFVEVGVDEDLGVVRVRRVTSAIAGGRIANPKTARSQILGGIVWGIGMALQEETLFDHALGRPMNANLAEYHVPVSADIRSLDVIFVEEDDPIVNPLGVKGLGEIGVVGVAAAIANAIYHATGRRVRDLPITLDKLLAADAPPDRI